MTGGILSALNIRKEEQQAVRLLVLYSFFMGLAIALFYTASISLFLHCFDRDMLPYVYIAGGLVIYLFGQVYRRIQQRVSIARILITGIIFLLISTSLISGGYIMTASRWIAFVMFLWINIFLFVHGLGFNGMAARIFDLQQGKRLFGIIGVGEVVSNVLGFFSVPLLLRVFPTEYLPMITLGSLGIALLLVLRITRRFGPKLTAVGQPADPASAVKKQKRSVFLQSPFTFFLFLLALLPVFGLYFVDFVFFGQTQMAFPQKEVLSGFLGIFFGVMALVEFLIKTFVFGWMTARFGVKPGLVALPLSLLFSTLLASLSGTFFGIAAMFSFVVLSKLFIRSVRNAVNDPSFLILYQVLPSAERFQFQGKVEGGPKALSNIIVGAMIIWLTQLNFTLLHLNYVFLAILLGWTWASLHMHGLYRKELRRILLKESRSNLAYRQENQATAATLFSHDKEEIKQLRKLIRHPDYHTRRQGLIKLQSLHYKAAAREVPLIKQAIGEEIRVILWTMASLLDLSHSPGDTSALYSALEKEQAEHKHFLFALLSLIFDPSVIDHIRRSFRAGTGEARAYAVELFDLTVTPDIKELVQPLLEELPANEAFDAYRFTFPQETLSPEERLIDILLADYARIKPAVKTAAIEHMIHFPGEKTIAALIAHVDHPDPSIRMAALEVLCSTGKYDLELYMRRFGRSGRKDIASLIGKISQPNEKAAI